MVHSRQLSTRDSGFLIRFKYLVFTIFPDLKRFQIYKSKLAPKQIQEEKFFPNQSYLAQKKHFKWSFYKSLISPLCRPESKSKKKPSGTQSHVTLLSLHAFWYKTLLNLPKNLGKRTKIAKNIENCAFFKTSSTPPCQTAW